MELDHNWTLEAEHRYICFSWYYFYYTIFYNYIGIRHNIYLTYWLPYGSEAMDVDTHMRVRIQLEQADRVNPPITAADS